MGLCSSKDRLYIKGYRQVRLLSKVAADKVPCTAITTTVSLISPIISTVIPLAVQHLYLKYGFIDKSTLKPLGRPCIPFHSIPQTAEAGSRVYRLPGVQ
ncbi:hypothetical protein XELAEV_18027279mg [Xenopus laevis]|uniref:Uncharacterized protein n=1 Tax=Xenopus laevis TaxID=8355 RepID=A0A974CW20_XENLA|nr:hypothetical protein XELAEV_18027279mg [Xenopus laevis]